MSSCFEGIGSHLLPDATMSKQSTQIEVSEYAERPELWTNSGMAIDEHGHVEGTVHIFHSEHGIDVTVGVTSYEYERGGETNTNHVPHIVVSDPDGTIRQEPYARDSHDPHTAIKRAIQTAEWAYEEYR